MTFKKQRGKYMGLFARMETVFKSKMNKVLNRMEDPRETLDYSYEKQLELAPEREEGSCRGYNL